MNIPNLLIGDFKEPDPKKPYRTEYAFEGNGILMNVISEYHELPNLLVWQPSPLRFIQNISLDDCIGLAGQYLINMTDEEHDLIIPQLSHVFLHYPIHALECYPDSIVIGTRINGKYQDIVITILNMINDDHLFEMTKRYSLN